MTSAGNDYDLWSLVLLNSVIFIGFSYSFFKPSTLHDWRSFGAYSAFGEAWRAYAAVTPRFVPAWGGGRPRHS